jgi:hypothetical protein
VQQRSTAIAAVLSALNVPHRIVNSATAFETEFRCGTWNAYWISGGAIKLSIQLAKELREAVRRGEGLIMDGVHDSRNQLLHPIAGVRQIGKLPGQGYTAAIEPGRVFDASVLAALPTLGQPTRFEPTTGQVAGTFGTDPAIVQSTWGEGHGMLFAFDLAAMLAAPGGATHPQHLALLEAGLRTLGSTSPLTQGDVALLASEVVNRGSHAVDIEVRASLPTGVSYVNAQPQAELIAATPTSPAQVIWRTTLIVGASVELKLRVRIDASSGTLELPVKVNSLSATAEPKLQATVAHELVVQAAATLIDAAVLAIQALAPSAANDRAARNKALSAAQQARQYVLQGNPAAALVEWITAADAIAGVASDDIATLAAAQLGIARAMEASTDALCTP